MMNKKQKLGLGTVQFGMHYGVANNRGQVSKSEVRDILNLAKAHGVSTLDTAIAYGESEKVLGGVSLAGFDIVTKLPAIPSDCKDISEWVTRQLDSSLMRLNVSNVSALLLHRPDQLFSRNGDALYKALLKVKKEKLVDRIGISIYSPEDFFSLAENYKFDLIQAPFNIIDSRLKEAGLFKKLASSGTQLHVRSIFMQGLLLMSANTRPKKFDRWASLWSTWDEWLKGVGLTPLQACLRYALSIPEIEKVIIGVDSTEQLSEIIKVAEGNMPIPPPSLSCIDSNLLNPSLWNNL